MCRYQRAIAKGPFPEAMWSLAQCYHYGRGVSADPDEAMRLYQEACRGGYRLAVESMWSVAEDFRIGRRVEIDEAKARQVLNIALQLGSTKAEQSLRDMDRSVTQAAQAAQTVQAADPFKLFLGTRQRHGNSASLSADATAAKTESRK
jgi:TPR repeat protein